MNEKKDVKDGNIIIECKSTPNFEGILKVHLWMLPWREQDLKEYSVILTAPFYGMNNINEKRLFPKFQLILIFRLQAMLDYVRSPCSIDLGVK